MILNNYQKYFSQSGFSSKVLSLAKRAGGKLLYPAFVLYTAYKSNEVSIKDKASIIGAYPSEMFRLSGVWGYC